ncbi:hypothetical protein DFA_11001 [Cavenderia fasciculata]|uniref:THH1/TOM1/TOM3 domain-containing protein n=1 Tax=Cavenderia fasciculata TaxID=261658 RepID=F4QC03_CACFS|nr:uncharacterized protein DFA_11001 [Cavenderia fasciculata]EGG14741.1 hypothetical protein DFA_11001 [Cavenderia fasciculata]|eukprot:XP_004351249.1 hypothetical protein DFA_11001 [Cavenderia fasciculata]
MDDYSQSHIFLSALYFVFSFGALIGYRIKHVWEKYAIGFMLLVVLGGLLRAVSFLLYILELNDVIHLGGKILNVFSVLPSFLFITAYTISLILGLIINERKSSQKGSKVDLYKRGILIFNIIMYVVVLVFIVLDFSLDTSESNVSVNEPTTTMESALQLFDAIIYLSTPIFIFVVFFIIIKKGTAPEPSSDLKTRQVFAIIIVSAIVCFVLRGVLVIVTTFYPLNYWWKDVVYYVILEVLPLSCLLYIMSTHESQKYLQGSPPLLGEHYNRPYQ